MSSITTNGNHWNGMHNPTVILLPPCKDNIFYQVLNFDTIDVSFRGIVHQLLKKRTNYKWTIIYYRTIMFTGCVDDEIKSHIIHSFTPPSCLKTICATAALGMRVDCKDVREVILLDDVESYIQETGRADRDNLPSKATLLTKRSRHINKTMKEYCSSKEECRRHFLFNNMESYDRRKHSVAMDECCTFVSIVS